MNEQLLDWMPENQLLGLNKLLTSIGQYMHQEVALRKLKDFVSVQLKCSKTASIIKTIEEFYNTNQQACNGSVDGNNSTVGMAADPPNSQQPSATVGELQRISDLFSDAAKLAKAAKTR